jgi:DNA-binding transcriptional MocR family regulator
MGLGMSIWRPELPDDARPAYARIVARLDGDIESGALAPGARLPTQRALAEQLGLGVGTITRAYAEAEAQGLIEAVVGRGSFVAARSEGADDGHPIDLGRNVPPLGPARAALRQAIAAVSRRGDLVQRLDYAPPGGFEADRRAGAVWLRRAANFPSADSGRLTVCAGAQQAITTALAAVCRSGDAVVAEAATFHGVKLAAAHLSLRLVPAAMDGEGMTPDSLDRAVGESGARAAYVLPFQNPTARVMGLARRRDIIEIARRRGIVLIEDDLYGPQVADLGLPPLGELAPDVTAYVSGLSKSLAPGLRTGFLIMPDRAHADALEALRAVAFGAPTFGAVIAAEWIESGQAFAILEAVRDDLAARTELARRRLAGLAEPVRQRGSPHLWLPLSELEAERVAGEALRAGAQVTPPRAPFLAGVPVSGLRICLGAAPDLASLDRGLTALVRAVQPDDLGDDVV